MRISALPARIAAVACVLATGCGSATISTQRVVATPVATVAATPAVTVRPPTRTPASPRPPRVTPTPRPKPPPTPRPSPRTDPVVVTYRVEVRVADGQDFASLLAETMSDPRGWVRAGFRIVEDPQAVHRVVLAEGAEVDELCRPYDTGGDYSCQNGPVVAINAERWRSGVAHWPGGLHSYRQMLLTHEMGHLIGRHHVPCPAPGAVAPVMMPQSGSLKGCRANSWPLDSEIARAASEPPKIAPGYGE